MSELKDKIKDILEDIAVAKAHGNYADGLWHYLRAYPNGKEETGWEFIKAAKQVPVTQLPNTLMNLDIRTPM